MTNQDMQHKLNDAAACCRHARVYITEALTAAAEAFNYDTARSILDTLRLVRELEEAVSKEV
jgi:hypothetical protein